MEMPSFLLALDPYLIWFYRLPGNAYAGFFLGTFILALICLLLGQLTISAAYRLAGKHLDAVAAETLKYQDLSIEAAKAGDKTSYKAANKMANEAFGKSFFFAGRVIHGAAVACAFRPGLDADPFSGSGVPHPRHRLVPGLHRGVYPYLYRGLSGLQAAALDAPGSGKSRARLTNKPVSGNSADFL